MIYLDHNATTQPDTQVIEAMLPYLTTFYGNPSSLYRLGRMVRSAIDTAREQVAALVDATPAQIIFTSGGTESNNLALNAVSAHSVIAVSAIEHPSILEVAKKKQAPKLALLPVDANGVLRSSVIETLFQQAEKPALVSVMLANNETGAIQDIKKIAQLLSNEQCILHTDAIQAVGKIPVSFKKMGVNLMSLSSHKIYGPKGCGALVTDNIDAIEPLLIGGGQEKNLRAGTENVAAIVGFGKAAELALQQLEQRMAFYRKLRDKLEQELKTISGLVIFSEQAERLPNTIQFSIEGIDGEMLLMQLDKKNIAVSSGSACAANGGKVSSVLTAMGVNDSLAKSAIRISLGKENTEQEITAFINILKSFLGLPI